VTLTHSHTHTDRKWVTRFLGNLCNGVLSSRSGQDLLSVLYSTPASPAVTFALSSCSHHTHIHCIHCHSVPVDDDADDMLGTRISSSSFLSLSLSSPVRTVASKVSTPIHKCLLLQKTSFCYILFRLLCFFFDRFLLLFLSSMSFSYSRRLSFF
jgi:hypothetical protein